MGKILTRAIAPFSLIFVGLVAGEVRAESFNSLLEKSLSLPEKEVAKTLGANAAMDIAKNSCNLLKQGNTVTNVATQTAISVLLPLAGKGVSEDQLQTAAMYTGKVIAAGVVSFCPEYTEQLQELQTPGL